MSPSPASRPPISNTALLGGLAAGALGGVIPQSGTTTTHGTSSQEQENTQTQNSSSQLQSLLNSLAIIRGSQTGKTTGTTTPNLTPEMRAYLNNLVTRGGGLATPSLTGYQANQTAQINANAALQSQAVDNIMASRGLSTSPVAGTAQAGVEQNRINQITGMQQQIPLLQHQMAQQDLATQAQLASILPGLVGTTTAQTTEQTQEQQQQTQQQQEQTMQALANLYSLMQGTTTQDQTQTTKAGGGIGGALSGIAQMAGALIPFLSDKRLKKDIKEIDQNKAIDKVRALGAKTWTWKGGNREDSGFIAQEVEQVIPDAVDTVNIDGKEVKAINYGAIIPYLVGAVQALDSRK